MRPAPGGKQIPAPQARMPQKGISRHFDGYLLLIPLLSLVAIWPLLTQSLPVTDDGANHLKSEPAELVGAGVVPLR